VLNISEPPFILHNPVAVQLVSVFRAFKKKLNQDDRSTCMAVLDIDGIPLSSNGPAINFLKAALGVLGSVRVPSVAQNRARTLMGSTTRTKTPSKSPPPHRRHRPATHQPPNKPQRARPFPSDRSETHPTPHPPFFSRCLWCFLHVLLVPPPTPSPPIPPPNSTIRSGLS
jgi:hypothetical protein